MNDISSRLTTIYIVGSVAGVIRPFQFILEGWADEGDFISAGTVQTMEVQPTADGRKQQWATNSVVSITINLSPTSPNWWHFAQVLQEQAGYGNLYLATAWEVSFVHKSYKVMGVDGTLTEGAPFPTIGTERLGVLPFTFKFLMNNLKVIPI